jgi:hypothetical protein
MFHLNIEMTLVGRLAVEGVPSTGEKGNTDADGKGPGQKVIQPRRVAPMAISS